MNDEASDKIGKICKQGRIMEVARQFQLRKQATFPSILINVQLHALPSQLQLPSNLR